MRAAIDVDAEDALLEREWKETLEALHDLGTSYPWRSRQKRQKLEGIANAPRLVRATQTAVVGTEAPPLEMLAVLAIDSSEASLDALIPQFAGSNGIERLEALRLYARDSATMAALIRDVETRLGARHQASRALSFVQRTFGIDASKRRLKFELAMYAQPATRRPATHLFEWSLNSREQEWWRLNVVRFDDEAWSRFGSRGRSEDALELGECGELENLPKWLEGVRRRLKLSWYRPPSVESSLRGRQKERVIDWLFP